MAGRKPKLDKVMIKKASQLIKAGNTQEATYKCLGISHQTWYRWLEEGRKTKSGLKGEFSEAIKIAEGEAEAFHVTNISTQAKAGNWTASAWWLERRRHKDWGKKDQIEHVNHIPIKIVDDIPDEDETED